MRYTTNFPTVRGDETVLVQGMASRMSPSTSFGTGAGIAVGTCGNSGSKTLWKNWTIGKLWNNRFQTSWSSDLSKVKNITRVFFLPCMGAENKSTPAPGLEIYRGRILSTIFRWRITCPSLLGSGSPARVSDPVTSAFWIRKLRSWIKMVDPKMVVCTLKTPNLLRPGPQILSNTVSCHTHIIAYYS